jgi:cytochrome c oxidase subunit 2
MPGFIQFILNIQPSSIFDARSPQAERIRELTTGFIWAASAMLLLVIILTTWLSVKYRGRNNQQEPKQVTGNRKLEVLMVGIPLILVTGFFFWSELTMSAVLPPRGEQKPAVIITGHQWFWQADYPGTKVSTANEIHLPVGRKLLLQLNSADVIHDWWVPALGGKMDMIPGMDNYLWVTIRDTGVYDGACSEFCGQQHAWMRIRVVAQSPADYDNWLATQERPAGPPRDTLAKLGALFFLSATCGNCHQVKGTTAMGLAGPDLTHFGSRQTMLSGMMDNDSLNVERWLGDPQKVKPGAHMPRFIFAGDSIRALTAYLDQLK